jgi:hypothetical protein
MDAVFRVKYHAWVQQDQVARCIYNVFDDSPTNLAKMGGLALVAGSLIATGLMIAAAVF